MPPEPLDYEPAAKRGTLKQLLARVARVCVLIDLLVVVLFASLKTFLPFPLLGWPEIIYGPALTLASCFVLFAAAAWITSRGPGRTPRA